MSNISKIMAHAEQHCQDNGVRLTDKRKQVLISLLRSEKALSAYELVEHCKTEFGNAIPAMSIYRILDFLQEEKLVHKLNLANKYVACSHISCEHEHVVPQFLICGKCERVEEINISQSILKTMKKNVEEAGFHLVSPQLEMNCICKECSSYAA